ncbi:glycoside hydrolase family 105 protein [Cyathus striatus]|nr:glycoside hydrolase family 105 protein [Cyathus striatus]
MLRILLAGFIAFLSLSSGTYARPSSYAVWAADSAIARGQGNGLSSGQPIVSYEHGEFQWGLRLLYEMTGNKTYLNYIKTGVDNIVFDNGTVHGSYTLTDYVLDPLRTGPTFLYLYDLTKQAKYKTAADIFRTQLNSHPRTAQGQFWHKLKYPNQGWLDGIYMGEIFYATYTQMFQESNATAWSDITSQFRLMYENTAQNATAPNNTGLLYHGYDYSKKTVWASPDRGHSPEVWDRALGWYSMALVDVLDILPESSEGQTLVLNLLRTLVPHIRDAADKDSGAWWLVITQPGRAKNYFESSGTSMFVYSLLKAVRKGWISDADGSIVKAAKKAYNYAVNNWVVANADGTMGWLNTVVVGSLDTTGDFDYYVSQPTDLNDLKGLAAFLLASLEYEQL